MLIEVPEDLLRRTFHLLGKHVMYAGNAQRKNRMSYDVETLRIFEAIEALLPCTVCGRYVDPNAGEVLLGNMCNMCRRHALDESHATA